MAIEYKHIHFRRGTAGTWAAENPLLANGEPGWANGVGLKIGNGVDLWLDLPYLATVDQLAAYVAKTGDTMTGDLDLTTGEPRVFFTPGAGQPGGLTWRRGGSERWRLQMTGDAEAGGDLGSYLDVLRFNDAGVVLGIAMRWYRNSGVADFLGGLNIGTPPGPAANNIQVPDTAWVRARLAELRLTATANLNFPSITAGRHQDLTVTVTGAVANDVVTLGPPTTLNSGLVPSGFVSAANTVTVRLFNSTALAVDPAAADWKVMVLK